MPARWADGVEGSYSIEEPTSFEFVEFEGEDSVRVKDSYGDVLLVSRQHLDQVTRDREVVMRKKLDALRSEDLVLRVNQPVRLRHDGKMVRGELVKLDAKRASVRTADHVVHVVDRDHVFELLGPNPRTIRLTDGIQFAGAEGHGG